MSEPNDWPEDYTSAIEVLNAAEAAVSAVEEDVLVDHYQDLFRQMRPCQLCTKVDTVNGIPCSSCRQSKLSD